MGRPAPQPQNRPAVPMRFGLMLLLAAVSVAPQAGLAQVAAGGLGTRVNGTALGRCSVGVCSVQGGSAAGPNLFHRFSQFDTRAGIQRVDLDSRGRSNVVVGVSHPAGSFFGAPLRLSGAANLFWLSPGGIWLGNGARFHGATSLLLSTAPSLRIGGAEFNALGGLADRLGAGADAPSLDIEALARGELTGDTLATGSGPIVLAGGRLTVDRHLLLHSGAGPILTAPGERNALQAGGSVQLSGGNLQLRGLDIQAGTGSVDDRLLLRSGALVGGALGRLELADATLRGSQVRLEGAGGLALERVEARAEGAAGPGVVQLSGGTSGAAAAARLDGVSLTGGEVLVRASGPLAATDLRAQAGVNGGGGQLELAGGAAGAGESSLRLERTDLQGRNVLIGASGPIELDTVRLSGSAAVVQAEADLRARDLVVQAERLWLRAEAAGGGGNLRLQGSALRADELLSAEADGDLELHRLAATARTIDLQASGRLALDGTLLRAPGDKGSIQIFALPSAIAPQGGRLDFLDSSLEAQTILASADRSLILRNVSAQAGAPGRRGLIQLETAPAPEPPNGPGAGASGSASLTDTHLEGQRVALRSGTITLSTSHIEAPKGQIHLEAKAGDLEVSDSTLQLTASNVADLRSPVNSREDINGVPIDLGFPTPSLGLFAAGNILIREDSHLRGGQDLTSLLALNPRLQRTDIQLTDTSGIVIVDAGFGLTVRDSQIEANASHNLAGNVLLRAQSLDGQGKLSLINAQLSASGGAGSGDLRLHSANGINLELSQLVTQSTLSPEDINRPGQADWGWPISGGEITLTNSSTKQPISISRSQLRAEQTGREGLVRTTVLDGSDTSLGPLLFQDLYDDSDRDSIGGVISLVSSGGMRFADPSTTISVDSRPPGSRPLESIGGTVRIVNFSSEPIQLEGSKPFSFLTASPLDSQPPSRSGELILVDSIANLPASELLWGEGRQPNPYLLQPGSESDDHLFLGGNYSYVGGLPQEIRDRVKPRDPDVVIPVGAAPSLLDLPSYQRQLQPPGASPTADSASAIRSFRPAADLREPLPSLSLRTPQSSTRLTLAVAGTADDAASALSAEASQVMSEEAATRSLQAIDQAAAQRVSAALGLELPRSRSLEVAGLQNVLQNAMRALASSAPRAGAGIHTYTPAILQISSAVVPGSDQLQINHILIPSTGEIKGWQTRVTRRSFQRQLAAFQRQLSQNDATGAADPGEELSAVLLTPLLPELKRLGVNALLLALDRGLQGVPFAALPVGEARLVDRMAITVTPSLALADLDSRQAVANDSRALLAGTSHFSNGLAPLPMATQELRQLASLHPDSLMLLESAFSNEAIVKQIESHDIAILHLATHADFSSRFAEKGRIYTHNGELSLLGLGRHLRRIGKPPIGLFVLNGCRTAVGNEDQELGISGLALQANAYSALGNLWYVDDMVTAAFSVQFHRALQQGLTKDEALRRTQLLFRQGRVSVRGAAIVNDRGDVLIDNLDRSDQVRLNGRLNDPYYWAGVILSGRPW